MVHVDRVRAWYEAEVPSAMPRVALEANIDTWAGNLAGTVSRRSTTSPATGTTPARRQQTKCPKSIVAAAMMLGDDDVLGDRLAAAAFGPFTVQTEGCRTSQVRQWTRRD